MILERDGFLSTASGKSRYPIQAFENESASEEGLAALYEKRDFPTLPLWDLISEQGQRFTLKKPLAVTVTMEKGTVTLSNEVLGVYSGGSDLPDALADFIDQVVFALNHYSNATEANLTGQALELKRIVSELI